MTETPPVSTQPTELDKTTILLHFGLMVFGVAAWLVSFGAGDYKHVRHFWFSVHKWLGLGAAAFVAARLGYGLWGPEEVRFSHWVPYTPERLKMVLEDLGALLSFKLPQRGPREGLASLWEAFGLAVFTWMAATGFLMYLALTPGARARGFAWVVKELHELGEWLVPVFLAVHLAAVTLHALTGDHRWRKMFYLKG